MGKFLTHRNIDWGNKNSGLLYKLFFHAGLFVPAAADRYDCIIISCVLRSACIDVIYASKSNCFSDRVELGIYQMFG